VIVARPEGFEPPTTWFEAKAELQAHDHDRSDSINQRKEVFDKDFDAAIKMSLFSDESWA